MPRSRTSGVSSGRTLGWVDDGTVTVESNTADTAESRAQASFEVGIFTFGELTRDSTGQPLSSRQRLHDLLERARVADDAGLDVFGVGEHHREDFAVSSPAVVLAAAAAMTQRIRLTSTVTVLSSADPVRVVEDFATLDLLSGGRGELTVGRGAYVESFPLFGQDLARYDEYFEDRLDLLLQIRDHNPVTWTGTTRPSLESAGVWPRPAQPVLPIWTAVGGTEASVQEKTSPAPHASRWPVAISPTRASQSSPPWMRSPRHVERKSPQSRWRGCR
jgi:hypothetical protein